MLTSIKNPLIKQIRKLHRSSNRHKQNLLLLEGTNLLTAACQVNYKLVTVCCTPKWRENHQQLWQKISHHALQIELVSPEILSAIATTVNPDGVVATAVGRTPKIPVRENMRLGLALERLQDPGNLGTIIRTAVAADLDSLWLSQDSVDFDNPKVLRASVGEWFRLPMAVSQNLSQEIKQFQQQGVQVIATLPQAKATYWEIDFNNPTLILLGNEGAGLSEELVNLADLKVKIPLSNQVESLNVAITTALLLYEAQRQRRQLK
jgi:TrmH family RNA methyltransferase